MRTYRHAMSSLREVLLFSEHFDDREFIVYQDVRWTYRHTSGWSPSLLGTSATT